MSTQATTKFAGVTVPEGLAGKELFHFLKANKAMLMAEKKMVSKEAPALTIPSQLTGRYQIDTTGKLVKAATDIVIAPAKAEEVINVINTTNWLDSHKDVHIPSLWVKSLNDNRKRGFLHLQEHKMAFTHIIADDAKGYTEIIPWRELGLDIPGFTEALVFDTKLTGRNPFMEDQYRQGFVKNHSVGMRYVQLEMCINEPDDKYYREEYEAWQKYFPMVINAEEAEAEGFFWAVTEAKIIEGSAVPMGSNIITPSRGFKSVQPPLGTEHSQPPLSTGSKGAEAPDEQFMGWLKSAQLINI